MNTLMRFGLALALIGGAAYAGANDDATGAWQTLSTADSTEAFWNFGPNYPGNGAVDLGEDDDNNGLPDTIIWCLDGDSVGYNVLDQNQRLTLFQQENRIYDAAGGLQCTAHQEGELFKLREGVDGPVVLTASKDRFVFAGDVKKLPKRFTKAWRQLVRSQLAYEFYGNELYDGRRLRSDVAATANEHIARANPMRKLLIGALYSGVCGVDGSTDETPR